MAGLNFSVSCFVSTYTNKVFVKVHVCAASKLRKNDNKICVVSLGINTPIRVCAVVTHFSYYAYCPTLRFNKL